MPELNAVPKTTRMPTPALTATSATRKVDPDLMAFLRLLRPGDRVRITQTIRVGARTWTATVSGVFRDLNYLSTGLSTSRVPDDDIVVPTLHFTKDNGEMASVTLDENSQVEKA